MFDGVLKTNGAFVMQAQVLTEKEAAVRMEHVFRPSPLSVPVMFFGTLEIAWIAPVEVVSWADGVKAKYLKKNKTRRKFLKSVEEVAPSSDVDWIPKRIGAHMSAVPLQ